MLDRQHGELVFECDGCEATLDTGSGDWDGAQAELKRASWRPRKIGSDRIHLCPKCTDAS